MSRNKIGKLIGGDLYVHRDYVRQALQQHFPNTDVEETYLNALDAIQNTHPEHKYTIVKVSPKNKSVSFIASPDFDEASEPTVGESYLYKGGIIRGIKQAKDPWIYHGKEQMVGPDYKGFDVGEAIKWHNFWSDGLKTPRSRIGKRSVWERVKPTEHKLSPILVRVKKKEN